MPTPHRKQACSGTRARNITGTLVPEQVLKKPTLKMRTGLTATFAIATFAWQGPTMMHRRMEKRMVPRNRIASSAPVEGEKFDIHALGLEWKERGLANRNKARDAPTVPQKLAAVVTAAMYLALFTVYRAYRGFFVILPAVFVEVRAKLERRETVSLNVDDDINPKTGKVKLRSTILMNIGAAVFTTVYVFATAFSALARLFTKRSDPSSKNDQENLSRDLTTTK